MIRFVKGREAEKHRAIVGNNTYYQSTVFFQQRYPIDNIFHNAEGKSLIKIIINKKDPTWKMGTCHELGHVMECKRLKERTFLAWLRYGKRIMREEVRAWRIAKSFCNPKYWDDKAAIRDIGIYAKQLGIKINWKKFKIIELNRGVRL